jgi:hypothetical protein
MSTEPSANVDDTFQKKYTEFIADLRGTFPELEDALAAAEAIPAAERAQRYAQTVMNAHEKPKADGLPCPGPVLPGVVLTPTLWSSVSENTQKVVFDYLAILDLCTMFEGMSGQGKEWAEETLRQWRSRLDKVDFDSLSEKFMKLFGDGGKNLPPLPEKFLKGKLAKLAEDMVREFKPEDFGFSAEDMEACERNPTRAFEVLMQASMAHPDKLQKAMIRVAKKLQEKVRRGELKPQDLAAEAEEMIKEFTANPAFTELMESFRSAFSFDDPEAAAAAGQPENARRSIVRDRLRKKLEAKKAGKKN